MYFFVFDQWLIRRYFYFDTRAIASVETAKESGFIQISSTLKFVSLPSLRTCVVDIAIEERLLTAEDSLVITWVEAFSISNAAAESQDALIVSLNLLLLPAYPTTVV